MAEYSNREHYIPIRKTDLIELLCADPCSRTADQEPFRRFCRRLVATLHCEYHTRLEELKDAYAYFDPDMDTCGWPPPAKRNGTRRSSRCSTSSSNSSNGPTSNGCHARECRAALNVASDWGVNLDVDFDVFERLEIFARGDVIGRRSKKHWRTMYRLVELEVPVYQRLVVILRLRDFAHLPDIIDTESVYIKIFKDIPKVDLEMLLPGTRVKLTMMDRGKIVLPTISGIAVTTWKLLQDSLSIALSSAYNSLALLSLIGGTLGYGMKSFHGYMQTKQKYQLSLTQSLYYQNLDNNAGALFPPAQRGGGAGIPRGRAGLFLPADPSRRRGLDAGAPGRCDRGIPGPAGGIKVDFEIGDAIDKLVRFQLIAQRGDGLLHAVSLREASMALDRAWGHASHEFTKPHAAPPGSQRRSPDFGCCTCQLAWYGSAEASPPSCRAHFGEFRRQRHVDSPSIPKGGRSWSQSR